MNISLIAAIGINNELGYNNQLLWKLSDDLKFFKSITLNHHIIMGRKTFESIGRPLPKRINVVISRYLENNEIYIMPDLIRAIEFANTNNETDVFIIGGGQIYKEAIEMVNTMYITHVDASFENADVYFPNFNLDDWKIENTINYAKSDVNEFNFSIIKYNRKY